MTKIVTLIWFWCLPILPFTAVLTFILTLIICNYIHNNPWSKGKYPQISMLGIGQAYYYFVSGFLILLPQFLIILIGQILFLSKSQKIISRTHIYDVHAFALVSIVFLLIMAIVSVDNHPVLHVTGAFGMFGFISLYCFFHTIVVIRLFIHRVDAPQHSNVIFSIWFLLCSLLVIIFFMIWMVTAKSIPQYIAAAAPFLYLLGFVPQFWQQVRMKKRDYVLPRTMEFLNDTTI